MQIEIALCPARVGLRRRVGRLGSLVTELELFHSRGSVY